MGLLDTREGSNQVKVLSAIAEAHEEDETPQQKDIVEMTTLTKGAVSNNCTKLEEAGLIRDVDGYELQYGKLLDLYREHVEAYLPRKRAHGPLEDHIVQYNEVRTAVKEEIPAIFDRSAPTIEAVLSRILADARTDPHINTLREAFLVADAAVRDLAEVYPLQYPESDTSRHLSMLAVSMDRSHMLDPTDLVLEDFDGTPPKRRTADQLLEEINQ